MARRIISFELDKHKARDIALNSFSDGVVKHITGLKTTTSQSALDMHTKLSSFFVPKADQQSTVKSRNTDEKIDMEQFNRDKRLGKTLSDGKLLRIESQCSLMKGTQKLSETPSYLRPTASFKK